MKFDDTLIFHIAKVLQVALLTGTDIVDNLRMIRIEEKEEKLFMDSEYEKEFEENINNLMNNVENQGE